MDQISSLFFTTDGATAGVPKIISEITEKPTMGLVCALHSVGRYTKRVFDSLPEQTLTEYRNIRSLIDRCDRAITAKEMKKREDGTYYKINGFFMDQPMSDEDQHERNVIHEKTHKKLQEYLKLEVKQKSFEAFPAVKKPIAQR